MDFGKCKLHTTLVQTSVVRYPRYLDTYRFTYVTIPVSQMSRYTAVYRSSKKYRETAQVSRVSTIPRVSYHWATSSLQAYDAKTNVKIHAQSIEHAARHLVSHIQYCPSLGSIVIKFLVDKERGLKFQRLLST